MTLVVIEDFNSYTDGDLHGQGGWSGDTSFDVQGTTVYEGAKAVSSASGTNDIVIERSITARTSGIFSIRMRRAWTGQFNMIFVLKESTNRRANLLYRTNGAEVPILFNGAFSASATFGTVPSVNTWVKFDIEIDQANSQIRARMDDGTWSSWVTQAFTSIDGILLGKASNGTASDAIYDYITFDDGLVAAPNQNNLLLLGVS